MYPSGLDFLAASPVLRSPAAARAVQSEFGKNIGESILKAECGPMPDSLHGEAMKLLATLQAPLPAQAPAALRTEAWSDLQSGPSLARAEQRHTWRPTLNSPSLSGHRHASPGMGRRHPTSSPRGTATRRTAADIERQDWSKGSK